MPRPCNPLCPLLPARGGRSLRQGWSHPPATSPRGQSPGRDGCSKTHPCLIDRVVKLRFYRDLAVGVGVHEGQAEAGVVPTPVGGDMGVTGLHSRTPEQSTASPVLLCPLILAPPAPQGPWSRPWCWVPRPIPGVCGQREHSGAEPALAMSLWGSPRLAECPTL